MAACPEEIEGNSVDIKMAKSRPISKKVFVGGIDPNLTREQIASYFSAFGPINDIELPMDRVNKKRREFCFIIFETEEAANKASDMCKQKIYDRMCDVKKATPQPIAQQQKRQQQQNLHRSFNNSQQSNYHSLNQSRNSRSFCAYSPNSTKSGPSSYRGYRSNSRSDGHRNSFSGRRSVDSQHGGYQEQFASPHGYNRKNGQPHRQSERSLGRQGTPGGQYQPNAPNNGQTGHHQAKAYNNHHNKPHPQQQQQQQAIGNQPYYDQPTSQPFYNCYGVQYADYYPQQFPQPQASSNPHANLNQYQLQPPFNQTEYYNQIALNYYQQAQQTLLQQQYPMSPCYTNYQATSSDGATALVPPGQQQQPVQPPSANPADYQSLDERFFQDQKQFENNLISAATYDKLGSQDEINYQQMVNHSNLLNVPFQGSLQQC